MMNKISIKKKLLLYSFIIQAIVLIIFSFSLHKALEISTLDKLQTTLKVIVLDIVDDILEHNELNELKEFDEEKEYKFEPLYIRLLKVENKIEVVKSDRFPEDIKENFEVLRDHLYDTIIFENQKNYIIGKLKFIINKQDYIIEVATTNTTLNNTLENLLYILFFIVPIILIFATIGGYFLVYKSFSPIEKILKELKKINATNLSKRLKVQNIKDDEIDLLSKEINSLLTRLEISFDKISQFSSDASHELKTPLTIIRGEMEISLRKDRSIKEYKTTFDNCLSEVLGIQQTIDDLLFLAKSKEHLETVEEAVYLDEITLESGKELESFAKIKCIHINYDIKDTMEISGHSKLLKIALKNIIKNAIVFSYENSSIMIKNYSNKDYFIISVEDKGIGINKSEQGKIFEKFYRTDKSRSKDSGGTGLGMTICEKIISMHNGEILLQSNENIGTSVFFRFPIS